MNSILFDEFHITRCRTKVSGIVAHSTTRYAAWATLLGPYERIALLEAVELSVLDIKLPKPRPQPL